MNNDDDAAETVLTEITVILERQAEALRYNRQAFEHLREEVKKINQKLDKLESADSLDSSDAKFLKDVVLRLQAISASIPTKV